MFPNCSLEPRAAGTQWHSAFPRNGTRLDVSLCVFSTAPGHLWLYAPTDEPPELRWKPTFSHLCFMWFLSEEISCSSSSSISHLFFIIRSTMGLICCWIVLSHCSCSCSSDKNPEASVLWEQKQLRLKMPTFSAFPNTQVSSFMLKSGDSDRQTTFSNNSDI